MKNHLNSKNWCQRTILKQLILWWKNIRYHWSLILWGQEYSDDKNIQRTRRDHDRQKDDTKGRLKERPAAPAPGKEKHKGNQGKKGKKDKKRQNSKGRESSRDSSHGNSRLRASRRVEYVIHGRTLVNVRRMMKGNVDTTIQKINEVRLLVPTYLEEEAT